MLTLSLPKLQPAHLIANLPQARLHLLISSFLSCFFVVSCGSQIQKAPVTQVTVHNPPALMSSALTTSQISHEMIRLTNQHRSKLGLSTLPSSQYLTNLASPHAQYLGHKVKSSYSNFGRESHSGFSSRADQARAERNLLIGENVATINGYATNQAAQLFQTLLNSPPHRKAIETPHWSSVGVATYQKGDIYFSVQLFGRPLTL